MAASKRGSGRLDVTRTASDARLARRSKWAGLGVVLVLLSISVFAVWASQATGAAASRASAAIRLSDAYSHAAASVAEEESWEREYRLVPGADVESEFGRTADSFVAEARRVQREGGRSDKALIDEALVHHESYVAAVEDMFRAVDRGDMDAVIRIDRDEADPAFTLIEDALLEASEIAHDQSFADLAYLETLERTTRIVTPLVFLVGLIIAVLLASVTRGHRRQLVLERARAIHDSLHDPLSGLPNRRLLSDRLDEVMQLDAKRGTRSGLLFLDIDRFKDINDAFGHLHGDELLTQIGSRLTAALSEDVTVARLGGDEFAVLVPAVGTASAAMAVAVRLKEALEPTFRISGVDLNIEASIGVAVSGEVAEDAGTMMRNADIAMHVAKAQGLDAYAYGPGLDQHSAANLALLGGLRGGLDRHELVLHYQPKIDMATQAVLGAEALIRWQHPTRGMVFPDDFIPLAEQTALMGPLTRYVLDAALAQVRIWADGGHPFVVSVNLSARNLLDHRLPDMVSDLLAAHGVAPERLVLEVTESALMSDPLHAGQILERLAAMRVRISIDDFGAGYTSLSQLRSLPISELKIDKSFVMSMTEDASNAVIVESVIDLGHNLGMSVVAEGVETEQALAALARYGCDVAQGYHFTPAVPPAAFEAWAVEHDDRSLEPA